VRKLTRGVIALSTLSLIAPPSQAQSGSSPCPNGRNVRLRDGTPIDLRMNQTISSKTAAVGEAVSLSLIEDVLVEGMPAVTKGVRVQGEITEAKKAGRMGKAGNLAMRVSSITAVDGQRVAVRARRESEGDSKVTSTVVLTVLFGPLGLLKSGKNATLEEGSRIGVFVDGDIDLKLCPLPESVAPSRSLVGNSRPDEEPPRGQPTSTQLPLAQAMANALGISTEEAKAKILNSSPDELQSWMTMFGTASSQQAAAPRSGPAAPGEANRPAWETPDQGNDAAADQGNVWALRKRAESYFYGQGVPKDSVQALTWAEVAATLAQPDQQADATRLRDSIPLAAKMTPAQVAEAQKLARAWLEAFRRRD
jgi:hypothetical protein